MRNFFDSPFKGVPLQDQVTNPNIRVGKHSYYSGYYHGHSFDDCARYLLPDEGVDKLIIGSFCSIGSGAAFIMAGNQGHRPEWVSTFPFHYSAEYSGMEGARDGYERAGDTVIGSDVWIGTEAIIMPGIQIGHGAVIGTRTVVTKNVESYAIVVGNPARSIRKRFDDQKIALLLEMNWWNWEDEEIRTALPLLTNDDIEGMHRYWSQGKSPK